MLKPWAGLKSTVLSEKGRLGAGLWSGLLCESLEEAKACVHSSLGGSGVCSAVKGPMELSGEVALLSILIILMGYVNG